MITISVGDMSISAELFDTPTAREIIRALPIESRINTWGDEIYFSIPLQLDLEPGARADVEVGELGYWPAGNAFCIFFGPTPMSTSDKPRAASAVNVFGKLISNHAPLKTVSSGTKVTVNKA